MLGTFEVPAAVVVPAGEEIFVPMCRECDEVVATEICGDCDEAMFCTPCGDRLHLARNMVTHLRIALDKCDECLFQVAVKYCNQCGDNFCASCFAYLHRRGRLRRHTFEPLVAMCHDCGERAQVVRCFGCHPEGALGLCRSCQDARHAKIPSNEQALHRVEAVRLGSTKLKLMKAKECARAKGLLIEAEFAAALEKEMNRKRQGFAIKIQALWRGCLTRRRKKHLISKLPLLRIQRQRDDQARKMKTYKLRLWLGNAPRLKTDTDQEIVLKQYPMWWKETITDIVKLGIGWQEGAKMVREQDFYADKVKGRERWEVLATRYRLISARRLLQRTERKQLRRETFYSRAVEAYRNARAKGGIGLQHMEALQQASRKAKRLLQHQDQERREAKEAYKKAEGALEALVGPFRLRKIVNTALKEGMLMSFSVSVNRGEAVARLEKGHRIQEVLKWVSYGRCLRIDPPSYGEDAPIARPPSCATWPFLVHGVKGGSVSTFTESGKDDTTRDASDGIRQRKGSEGKIYKRGIATAGWDAPEIATQSTSRAHNNGHGNRAGRSEGKALRSIVVPQSMAPLHSLILDRQWLLASASSCRVYAMPLLPFPQKAAMNMVATMKYSGPAQALVKAIVKKARANKRTLEGWQTKFDEDSPMYSRLGRWAEASQALSESMMFRRQFLFDTKEDDGVKAGVMEISNHVTAAVGSVQDINSPSRSGAARRIPMSQVQHDKSTGLSGGLIDGEVTQQLFKMWVRSDDKDMVIIMYRLGRHEVGKGFRVVGHIEVDLDTPTPVLREFIRRFCGPWLNKHAKGDRFLMEDSKGNLVPRSEEGSPATGTVLEMIQERVSSGARYNEDVIFLRTEADSEKPEVAVEMRLVPEEDFLDAESMPTFDDDNS